MHSGQAILVSNHHSSVQVANSILRLTRRNRACMDQVQVYNSRRISQRLTRPTSKRPIWMFHMMGETLIPCLAAPFSRMIRKKPYHLFNFWHNVWPFRVYRNLPLVCPLDNLLRFSVTYFSQSDQCIRMSYIFWIWCRIIGDGIENLCKKPEGTFSIRSVYYLWV